MASNCPCSRVVLGKQTLTTLVSYGSIPFKLGDIDINDFSNIRLRPALFIPHALRQCRLQYGYLSLDLRPLVIGRSLLLGDLGRDELRLLQQPYHRLCGHRAATDDLSVMGRAQRITTVPPAAIRRCVRHCTAATPTTEAPAAKQILMFPVPCRQRAIALKLTLDRLKGLAVDDGGNGDFNPFGGRSTDARRLAQPSVFAEERAPDVRLIGQNLIDAGLIPDARCAAP